MSSLEYWQSVLAAREDDIVSAEIALCEARDERAHAARMIRELQATT